MKRRSEEEWAAVVNDWRQSRLSASQYARSKGIGIGSLLNWGNRFAQKPGKKLPRSSSSDFVEVTVDKVFKVTSILRITTPNGCCIEVPL